MGVQNQLLSERGAMKHIEVEYAEMAKRAGEDTYRVAMLYTNDDGSTDRILHIMPAWSVEARMAEYGVDRAEAVDILIAEPLLPPNDDVPPVLAAPLWRDGAAEHRATVAELTAHVAPLGRRVDGDAPDPLDLLRSRDIPASTVEALRMEVAEVRSALRDRPRRMPPAGMLASALPPPVTGGGEQDDSHPRAG